MRGDIRRAAPLPPVSSYKSRENVVANRVPAKGLGLSTEAELHWNLMTPQLVEQAVRRGEGVLAKDGPLVVETGEHTGRSPRTSSPVATARPRHDLVGQ
jgi:ATP-dependent phosphoenolpyruvate carboxykinase